MDTENGHPSGPPPGFTPAEPSVDGTTDPSGPTPSDVPENPLKPRTLVFGAAVVIVALIAGLFVATGRSSKSTEEALAPALGNEVFLEPAQSIGTDPFFAETAELVAIEPVLIPVATAPAGLEFSSANNGQTVIEATTASANQASNGATPGLYGGTEDNARCNKLQLVEFLEANEVKGAAWAEVQGIRPDQIREFVDTLTPAVLLKDTRVTNHGFRDGKATPIQSVLQAGTAVLIDDTGMPRARCACGNPLNKPIPQSTVRYLGPAWDNFDPGNLQVVVPGPGTDTFVLQNLDGGDPFARPAGSNGEADFVAPTAVVNAIPSNIDVQDQLGIPSVTATIGGVITDGVIIKVDSAQDLGLATNVDQENNENPPESTPFDQASPADTTDYCALVNPNNPEQPAETDAEQEALDLALQQQLLAASRALPPEAQSDLEWIIENGEQAIDDWLDNNSIFADESEIVTTPLMDEFEIRVARLDSTTTDICGFSPWGGEESEE